ncbi:hypothetical protein BH10PLA1_BH10PLA1_17050 [soil metagenome]
MSIEIKCGTCSKRFRVADRYAGKRVKCSNCSAAINVPEALPTHETRFGPVSESELNSDQLLERVSSIELPMGEEIVVQKPRQGIDAAFRAAKARPVPRKFRLLNFPGAAATYLLLPWVVGLLCLIPTIWRGTQIAMVSDPMWVDVVEFSLTLILYIGLIVPLTTHGMRIAGRMLQFELPSYLMLRTFGLFALPFSLGAIFFWQIGVSGLIFGLLLGLFLLGPLLLVAFQLELVEAAIAWMMGTLFFGVTAAATVGMMFMAGLVIAGTIASREPGDVKHHVVTQGPVKSTTSQSAGPSTPALVGAVSVPTTQQDDLAGFVAVAPLAPSDTTAVAPNSAPHDLPSSTPQVVGPVALPPLPEKNAGIRIEPSRIVVSAEVLDWLGPVEALLPSGADSNLPAVLKRTPAVESVVTFDPRKSRIVQDMRFTRDNTADDQYLTMSGGATIIRLASWPRLRLEFVTGGAGSSSKGIALDEKLGTPKLLGISANEMLLIRRQSGGQTMLETWNLRVNAAGRVVKTPTLSAHSAAISPDGKAIAVAGMVDTTAQVQMMEPGRIRKFTIKQFDPRWPLEPAALSFSPDSTHLAVCLERGGGLLVAAWNLVTAKAYEEHVYPAGTFSADALSEFNGSALEWLPDNETYVLYGKLLVDAASGTSLGMLGVPGVVSQRVTDDKGIELLATAAHEERRVVHVELNVDAITEARHATTMPATAPAK